MSVLGTNDKFAIPDLMAKPGLVKRPGFVKEPNLISAPDLVKVPDLEIEYLVKAYGREIYVYCYHLLRNREDAEDAVQEIFIKAFDNLKRKKISSVSLWLHKVAYNHCLNKIRKRKFKIHIPFDDNMFSNNPTPEDELEASEFSEQAQKALDKLSDLQKNIVILRAVKGFNYEDISRIVHKSPETIRKNFERAKRKIIKYFNSQKS